MTCTCAHTSNYEPAPAPPCMSLTQEAAPGTRRWSTDAGVSGVSAKLHRSPVQWWKPRKGCSPAAGNHRVTYTQGNTRQLSQESVCVFAGVWSLRSCSVRIIQLYNWAQCFLIVLKPVHGCTSVPRGSQERKSTVPSTSAT